MALILLCSITPALAQVERSLGVVSRILEYRAVLDIPRCREAARAALTDNQLTLRGEQDDPAKASGQDEAGGRYDIRCIANGRGIVFTYSAQPMARAEPLERVVQSFQARYEQ
ncbi:hypothetical protein [Muricoccus radiodurans]|uniref:hypothetical protein n=1 Tax=Muricoccus radiodurans TaxID=2231721 RepID=UPI003CE91C1E